MSLVSAGGKLGVSYYCPETTVLNMMPDVTETDSYDILQKGGSIKIIYFCHKQCDNIWIISDYMS